MGIACGVGEKCPEYTYYTMYYRAKELKVDTSEWYRESQLVPNTICVTSLVQKKKKALLWYFLMFLIFHIIIMTDEYSFL